MKLSIIGQPYKDSPRQAKRRVIALYDPARQITLIDCDVDIVTLGLTVNALNLEYEKYLKTLDPEIACQIRSTTKKAVQDHEEN